MNTVSAAPAPSPAVSASSVTVLNDTPDFMAFVRHMSSASRIRHSARTNQDLSNYISSRSPQHTVEVARLFSRIASGDTAITEEERSILEEAIDSSVSELEHVELFQVSLQLSFL